MEVNDNPNIEPCIEDQVLPRVSFGRRAVGRFGVVLFIGLWGILNAPRSAASKRR
jgi:hypothetical protein